MIEYYNKVFDTMYCRGASEDISDMGYFLFVGGTLHNINYRKF